MFCDLVGSTALSEGLDPEAYREVLTSYQDVARVAIARYEGYIARYMGDGLLVYFGYPQAHEDDAERAVRAGLSVVERVQSLSKELAKRLEVRIGIATGLVVAGDIVGEGASEERAVLGETPNLAARLQGIAVPDTIVIAASTAELLSGRLTLEPLAPQSLKGIASPVSAFRVAGIQDTESRFAASIRGQLGPMVGRDDELTLVMRRWQRAVDGEFQLLLISGEPGIGKSRLVQAVRDRLTSEAYLPLIYQCSPFFQSSSFHPFVDQMRRAAGMEGLDAGNATLDGLEALLRRTPTFAEQDLPLFANLIDLPCDQPAALEDPEERRKATIQGLIRHLGGLSTQLPVAAIFEDVHWADPSTLEVLDRTIQALNDARVLLVLTYRPEFDCPWVGRPQSSAMPLSRISARETALLAASVAEGMDLPTELIKRIVERTDGIPLFVEELTRAVLESGADDSTTGAAAGATVPSSLQDLLMGRLDRLGPAKEIAQTGAVIGREFRQWQVAELAGVPESAAAQSLTTLMDAGLVFRHQDGASERYIFKHALVQDVAYQSLLQSRRRALHERAAKMFSQHSVRPELLAHHYEGAGDSSQALACWHEAARLAARQSAHTEALESLSKSLRLVRDLPADQERDALECDLELDRAISMRVIDRLDDAFSSLEAAERLASNIGDLSRLSDVCCQRGNLYFPMGRLDECLEQHERSLECAQSAGETNKEVRALSGLGDAYYLSGQMITAGDHFDRCIEIAREQGLDTIVGANLVMLGSTLGYQFRLEESRAVSREAVELSERLRLPRAGIVGHVTAAFFLMESAQDGEATKHLQRALELAQNIGAKRFAPLSLLNLAKILFAEGRHDEARSMSQEACKLSDSTAPAFAGPWSLGSAMLMAVDNAEREAICEKALSLLGEGCVGHNYLWFHRDAIDAWLSSGNWRGMHRHADYLEVYTRHEPLPWSDFYIRRGRALARVVGGDKSAEANSAVRDLIAEAEKLQLRRALPAMRNVIAS
jgi:class 3 adenylate cyclase/tetratricopeptide (TPR) repeat protein